MIPEGLAARSVVYPDPGGLPAFRNCATISTFATSQARARYTCAVCVIAITSAAEEIRLSFDNGIDVKVNIFFNDSRIHSQLRYLQAMISLFKWEDINQRSALPVSRMISFPAKSDFW